MSQFRPWNVPRECTPATGVTIEAGDFLCWNDDGYVIPADQLTWVGDEEYMQELAASTFAGVAQSSWSSTSDLITVTVAVRGTIAATGPAALTSDAGEYLAIAKQTGQNKLSNTQVKVTSNPILAIARTIGPVSSTTTVAQGEYDAELGYRFLKASIQQFSVTRSSDGEDFIIVPPNYAIRILSLTAINKGATIVGETMAASLLDTSGNTVATVTIPASQSALRQFHGTLTPANTTLSNTSATGAAGVGLSLASDYTDPGAGTLTAWGLSVTYALTPLE